MSKIKEWWNRITREEYQLIITVPANVVIHADGSKTETTKQLKYVATKLIKTSPTLFMFIDLKGYKHEIKFLNPVNFHIIKIW